MTKSNLKDLSLFNNDGAIFMGAKRGTDQCRVSLLGVPYDGTCCFRPGARFGPSAVREDSYGIETYCPQLNLDLEDINFADIGSLNVPLGDAKLTLDYISDATNILLKNNLKPLIIGGEHSITSGVIKSIITNYPDLIMLQLDAHADLRDEWLGSKFSHACTMKRCLEIQPFITSVIIGATTIEQLKENIESVNIKLTNELIKDLNEIQKIYPNPFP